MGVDRGGYEARDGELQDARGKILETENEVKKVIIGVDNMVRQSVMAVFARGHVLIDGLPGLAKTTLSLAMARALGGESVRFEGRPDFLPMQFLYVTKPDADGNPKFYNGPLLLTAPNLAIVLVDEITRFMSQSQAWWFEVMNEYQLTNGDEVVPFPHIRVFATKNKVTRGETNEIPQPQLDRFLINIEMYYPDRVSELRIMMEEKFDNPGKLVQSVNPVLDLDELERIVDLIQGRVQVSAEMSNYFWEVVDATRHPSKYNIKLEGVENIDELVDNRQNASGISPRGAAKWRRIAKVVAFRDGSDYLKPQHVISVAEIALTHRIFVNSRAGKDQRSRGSLAKNFLDAILNKISAPSGGGG